MKKPVAIISTDYHLSNSNKEQLKDLIVQKCELAKKLEVKILVCLGDVFHSRAGQKEDTLTAFIEILDIIHSYKLQMVVIPGNHDKQDYKSNESFLNPYRNHPALSLVRITGGVPIGDLHLSFLPYFEESIWVERLKELKKYLEGDSDEGNLFKLKKVILLSHQAINGSVNNDGSQVSCGIAVSDFVKFHNVFLGHYHDYQQVGSNVYHLPSIMQHNFGENVNKGFTILYSDGTFDLHNSKFKKFTKVSIDLNTISRKELEKITKDYADSEDNVKFEFTGDSSVLKSINVESFTNLGIKVSKETKEDIDVQYTEIITEYTNDSIVEEFRGFCESKDKNFDEGIVFLNKKLKQ